MTAARLHDLIFIAAIVATRGVSGTMVLGRLRDGRGTKAQTAIQAAIYTALYDAIDVAVNYASDIATADATYTATRLTLLDYLPREQP